jgi:hypothetical protein
MQEDTITYDSLASRPLPRWLTDRKEGLTLKPVPEMKIRDDRTIDISIALTIGVLLLSVVILTIYIMRKRNKN